MIFTTTKFPKKSNLIWQNQQSFSCDSANYAITSLTQHDFVFVGTACATIRLGSWLAGVVVIKTYSPSTLFQVTCLSINLLTPLNLEKEEEVSNLPSSFIIPGEIK